MAKPSRDQALDHVVVVMFENRSFDNALGRLYEPGQVRSFEGVLGKELSNPIPDWAEHGADRKVVPYGVAASMDTPNPDSGDAFPVHNTAETLFQRLEANGLTWRVYCDDAAVVPFTGMIHASQLRDRFANFHTLDQFLEDAEAGRLPAYSFIEPNLLHGHNDMHPSFNAMVPGLAFDAPSSLLGGEALLAQIYDAIRASASPEGSNAYNTLLMVNFDEHGGTYDHVPPPPAPPPDPGAPRGQMDFAFDRSGIRVPAIAVSPWIPERTVVNDEFRNTSVLHTMRERWSLGAPFSAREAIAPSLAPVISLDTPRAPEKWPDVVAQPVPAFDTEVVASDKPLSGLGRALFFGLLALGKEIGQPVPDIAPDTALTGSQGVAMVRDLFGHMFPNLQGTS